MAGPLLVVELPHATSSPAQATALIDACSSALRPGRCELPRESEEQRATAVAVVSFSGPERLKVLVEVGRRREDREVWLSEELSFRGNDATIEQYRSIGLTVAVLYRELSSTGARRTHGERARPDTSPPGKEKPVARSALPRDAAESDASETPGHASRTPDHRPPPWIWLTVRALAGTDPGTRRGRIGGEAGVGAAPVSPLVVGVSGRYLRADLAGVELTFASVGVGAGGSLSLSPGLWLRARAEVIAENLLAAAHDPVKNLNTHDSLWTAGLGGAMDLVWSPGGWWGVSVTVAPQRLARGAIVLLHEQEVGTTSPFSLAAGVGVEVYPLAR